MLKDDCFPKPESPLEQTDLVNHIFSGVGRAIRVSVLGGHDQQGDTRPVEHVGNSFRGMNARRWVVVELLNFEPQLPS